MKSLDDGLVLFDETIAVNVRNEARKRFELLRLNVCRIHIWARGGDGTQMTEVQVGETERSTSKARDVGAAVWVRGALRPLGCQVCRRASTHETRRFDRRPGRHPSYN